MNGEVNNFQCIPTILTAIYLTNVTEKQAFSLCLIIIVVENIKRGQQFEHSFLRSDNKFEM